MDGMKPCPDCGVSMWTYRTRTPQDTDRPFTGPEYFVGHRAKGEQCLGSHKPVIAEGQVQ